MDLTEKLRAAFEKGMDDPGSAPACFRGLVEKFGGVYSIKHISSLMNAYDPYPHSVEKVLEIFLNSIGRNTFESRFKEIIETLNDENQFFAALKSIGVDILKIDDTEYKISWLKGPEPVVHTVSTKDVATVSLYG